MHVAEGKRHCYNQTRASKAIMPGEIMDYQQGELAFVNQRYINITRNPVPGQNCGGLGSFVPLAARSSCPWKFVLNVDNLRVPREIFEAKCITPTCNSSLMTGCLDQSCKEVKQFTWVKRGPRSNMVDILEPISVGCTCACEMYTESFISSRLRPCT